MKKIVGLAFISLICLQAGFAHALDLYAGVHYTNVSDTANANVHGVRVGNGASFGLQHTYDNNLLVRAEVVGFSRGMFPSLGVGYNFGLVQVSAGVGRLTEEASYTFGGGYTDGRDAVNTPYSYVELSTKGFFVRAMQYDVNYTFTGYNSPNSVTQTVSEDRDVVLVGYRYIF